MSEYIFRFPASMPRLNWRGLTGYLDEKDAGRRMIGTTVEVRRGDVYEMSAQIPAGDGVILRLYELDLARITPVSVTFTSTDDPRQATTRWLAQIASDNEIDSCMGRIRRHKADGPGPEMSRGRAGLLCLSWDRNRPVIGRTYPVKEPWRPLIGKA